MKALQAALGLALLSAVAVSAGYSMHTSVRVRDLERRLHQAEALLHSHNLALAEGTTATRLAALEQRVLQVESAATRPQPLASEDTRALAQRVQAVEQKIKPHLEPLPPYVPGQ